MDQNLFPWRGLLVAGLLAGACGGGDDRPAVPSPYDPRSAPPNDGGSVDQPAPEEASATPVPLTAPDSGARCGQWFCADQLPQSGSAVAVEDFDGDGRPDLLLADTGRRLSTLGPLTLLHNDGEMHFSDVTRRAGLLGFGAWSAVFGDLDNDGDADLVLGGRRADEPASENGDVLVFYNDGRGHFAPPLVVPRWGAGVPLAIDLADLNADGRLDILASLSGTNPRETYAPRVLEAQGDGRFVAREAGLNDEGFTWITLATDLNDDQQPDVLTAHDGHAINQGKPAENAVGGCTPSSPASAAGWLNAAYLNDGTAGEVGLTVQPIDDVWTRADNTPMSLVRGDFDADGHMDLLTTQGGNPLLFAGAPNGSLAARSAWPGAWRRGGQGDQERGVGWGALARDLDLDGDVDALVAQGVTPYSTTGWANAIYLNDRAAGLTLAPAGTGIERDGEWSAMAAADFDGDGDDDLVLGAQTLFRRPCDSPAARALLLTKVSAWPGRHWLRVRLVGTVSNRDGLGAKIEGVVRGLTMIREVSRAGSTMSSSTRVVDFGLGEATALDVLRVRWPSGAVQSIVAVTGDREITVLEPRWLTTDAANPRRLEPVTVRLSAGDMRALDGAPRSVGLELQGRGRWVAAPTLEPATGDLVGRFTGEGDVWVRTVGARTGLRAALKVNFR